MSLSQFAYDNRSMYGKSHTFLKIYCMVMMANEKTALRLFRSIHMRFLKRVYRKCPFIKPGFRYRAEGNLDKLFLNFLPFMFKRPSWIQAHQGSLHAYFKVNPSGFIHSDSNRCYRNYVLRSLSVRNETCPCFRLWKNAKPLEPLRNLCINLGPEHIGQRIVKVRGTRHYRMCFSRDYTYVGNTCLLQNVSYKDGMKKLRVSHSSDITFTYNISDYEVYFDAETNKQVFRLASHG